MQRSKIELTILRKKQPTNTTIKRPSPIKSLFGFAEQSIKQYKLAYEAQELRQLNKNNINVQFVDVEFEKLINWLDYVERNNIAIKKANIQETDNIGIVNATFILQLT